MDTSRTLDTDGTKPKKIKTKLLWGKNSKNTSSLRNSNSKLCSPIFYNSVGPGDYSLPDLMAPKTQNGDGIAKKPAFSFGKKHSINAVVDKNLMQDLIGKDSPGFSRYDI
jgi:hypothetical protein